MYRITERTTFPTDRIIIEFIIPKHCFHIPFTGQFTFQSLTEAIHHYFHRLLSAPAKYEQYEIKSKRPEPEQLQPNAVKEYSSLWYNYEDSKDEIDKSIPMYNLRTNEYQLNDMYYDKNANLVRLDVSWT